MLVYRIDSTRQPEGAYTGPRDCDGGDWVVDGVGIGVLGMFVERLQIEH